MPDWVAVAHLPSYKVRRTFQRWSVDVPRAIMPNRQRTMRSFYTATGERLPVSSAPLPLQANEPARPAEERSYGDWLWQTAIEAAAQRRRVADARNGGAAATLPRERRHGILRVPAPWGVAPQQDALRGAIISYDSDGRCSYAATHKCHSSHNHWSRCLVVDHPDDAEFWGEGRGHGGVHPHPRTKVTCGPGQM